MRLRQKVLDVKHGVLLRRHGPTATKVGSKHKITPAIVHTRESPVGSVVRDTAVLLSPV